MVSIVLLSGPLAVGKSKVAEVLIGEQGFKALRSSGYLKQLCSERHLEVSRETLQTIGDQLDEETNYQWLLDEVALPQIERALHQERWLIDSVRKERQVQHFEGVFGEKVLHVHLWAQQQVLEQRYNTRLESADHAEGITPYEVAVSHPNEAASRSLREAADLAIDMGRLSSRAAAAAIAAIVGANEPDGPARPNP